MSRGSIEVPFPFQLDGHGRMVSPDYDEHIAELIEQLLFTDKGERVNRPELGAGLLQLLFDPLSEAELTSTEFLVQAAIQQWLGDLIQVEAVEVTGQGSEMEIAVEYVVRRDQQRRTTVFRPGEQRWTNAI